MAHKKVNNRLYVTLSISVPPGELNQIDLTAHGLGMNRSQFLVWLAEDYIRRHRTPLDLKSGGTLPPRIRRNKA